MIPGDPTTYPEDEEGFHVCPICDISLYYCGEHESDVDQYHHEDGSDCELHPTTHDE